LIDVAADFGDAGENRPARRGIDRGRRAIRERTGRRSIQGQLSSCGQRNLAFLGKSLVGGVRNKTRSIGAHVAAFSIG
jgi:hypothetical protein